MLDKLIARLRERRGRKGDKTVSLPLDLTSFLAGLSSEIMANLVAHVVSKRDLSPEVVEALADSLEAGAKALRDSLPKKEE